MHTLEQAMKHIVPGEQHVIVASRQQDGAVGLFYTREPGNWLVALSNSCQLDQVEVRPSVKAPSVVEQMRKRFASIHIASSALPWYQLDFRQVIEALDEYDLTRGCLVMRGGVKVNDPVYVNNAGRGIVTGFTRCGRVMVRLDRMGMHCAAVYAPRSAIKPVLRLVAAS